MAFDSTVGGVNANSYVSVADADAYITLRLYADEWTAAATETKEAALATATATIEELYQWKGEKTASTQALHWPATGATDCAGVDISSTTIPAAVKNAVCEQALYLLKFDASQTPTAIMQGLSAASVGSLSATFDKYATPEKLQARVQSILRCYGQMTGSNSATEATGAYIGRG